MKKMMFVFVLLFAVLIISEDSFSRGRDSYGNVRVDGYYRKDGTYVEPHYRTKQDRYKDNNWSTEGNINPYTGREGTKRRTGDMNPYYTRTW